MHTFRSSPLYKNVVRHICFWSIINIALAIYTFLSFKSITSILEISLRLNFFNLLAYAAILSIFNGTALGMLDYMVNKLFLIGRSFSRIMVFQAVISLLVFGVACTTFMYFSSHPFFSSEISLNFNHESRKWMFYLFLFQYSIGSMIVTFSNHVVKKYGRDVIVPMLLGFYRKPREEERVFMFLDLKSSTSLAEQLGHLRYSSLIQEFIKDINKSLDDYGANVYQYAGDEAILTWNVKSIKTNVCLEFFFACEKNINERREFYLEKYGVMPVFKAGVDCGKVTAVEIGDIKRDIAYHGDTLNTAARIQGLCNSTNQKLLISKSIVHNLIINDQLTVKSEGIFNLKGKTLATELYSVSRSDY